VAGPDDLQTTLHALPNDHLLVLRAALAGFDVDAVAALAGVPPEAVIPALQVAVAKLAHVLAHP
jgi:hypothetical protein